MDQIQGHLIFKSNGNHKQVEPSFQLAVGLHRFGSETASANSCINTGQIFGIGEGTVILYTQRVIIAFMDLWKEVVTWSLMDERRDMMRVKLRQGPDSMVGSCLKTVLECWMEHYHPSRFNSLRQKSALIFSTGLQATVVCDDRTRILHFSCQHPGSVYDARAWRNVEFYKHPERFFNEGRYLC